MFYLVGVQIMSDIDNFTVQFHFCFQAQLNTVMMQYQDLLSACTEVERLRDKAISEAHMLKEELNRLVFFECNNYM